MSLQEIIEREAGKAKRANPVQGWLESLNDEDKAAAENALAGSHLSTAGLLRAFKQHGAPFGREALTAYRKANNA